MLYKPGSRKGASVFKGTKLKHYWSEERCQDTGDVAGFYDAEVVSVPQGETEGDPMGIYLTICCKPSRLNPIGCHFLSFCG